jgi:hypothetical protein
VLHGPWPSLAPWGRHWTGAHRPPSVGAALAIAGAAVVAAISLPLDRAGIGWLVAAMAGAGALILARAMPAAPHPDSPKPLVVRPLARPGLDRYAWAAATVALIGVGTVRSAGWLFLLCLATATLTGALALAGGHSLRSIAAGYTMPVLAAFRSLPWLARTAARVRKPVEAAANVRVAATVAVSITLLVVFGALFASADAAFAGALGHLSPDVSLPTTIRWVFVFGVAALGLGGAAFLQAGPPDLSGLDATEGARSAGSSGRSRSACSCCCSPASSGCSWRCCSAAAGTCCTPTGSPTPSTPARASGSSPSSPR